MLPTGGISWHTAAIYCNWLHNGKSSDRASFLNGAYDVSTFGYGEEPGTFTDQLTRNVGAKYWIPSWDEWLKAAHYDPLLDRWWEYSTTSDTIPTYGMPAGYPGGSADNQANSRFLSQDRREFTVLLGAYQNVTSPWGLFDTAGGTSEWTEEWGEGVVRGIDGSGWGSGAFTLDSASSLAGAFPTVASYLLGFRLASAIPSPGVLLVLGTCGMLWSSQRNRRIPYESAFSVCLVHRADRIRTCDRCG
jgi:formylglycine-generating enzyme required for sulfatase activity